ncbi:MAG: hypothetical protein L3K23_08015 [Thermoplasmata archaeon]|nr:hypothetical protein [Thermoplasmata archaeon]
MSSLWGPSRRDEVHLLSALESLGSTSLAGLSAALSWSERKTERCLKEVVASGAAPLRYNAAQRTVEWVTRSREIAAAVAPPAPRSSSSAPPPLPTVPRSAPRPAPPPPPSVIPPAPSLSGLVRCPVCHASLTPTGTTAHGYCNKCGRLVTLQRSAPAAPSAPAPSPSSTSAAALPPSGGDRKAQEMFAAWVTARPVPCPKCRTPMGHHGLAEYSCPSCGQKVTFPRPELPSGPLRPTAPAASPSTPPVPPSAPSS